ncbi:MAG: endonuclease, partial [Frankiales bacterium]|nr:endonuclease [Frankiales bacterium]
EGITVDQWEYQLILQLLTGDIRPGAWQAQVIVPFTMATNAATGEELELAEIPGYGPILPSTARQLLEDAEWTQVAVDQDGVVIAVGEPVPAPRPTPARSGPAQAAPAQPSAAKARMRENWELSLAQLMSQPPKQRLMPEQLSSAAYATPLRLRRYLQARDRTCVLPGCHRRITDVDHRIPWPLGPTAPDNLQLLCRHHHRAKQAVFTVELTPDGDYLWTSRGGWQFLRHRQGY